MTIFLCNCNWFDLPFRSILTGLGQWDGKEEKFEDLIFLLRTKKLRDMYKCENVKAYCQFLRYIVSNVIGKWIEIVN